MIYFALEGKTRLYSEIINQNNHDVNIAVNKLEIFIILVDIFSIRYKRNHLCDMQ